MAFQEPRDRELLPRVGVSVILLVGVALVIQSIAIGFTFLVAPIVVAELLFIGAIYLIRQGLVTGEDDRGRRRAWYARRPETSEETYRRLREPVAHGHTFDRLPPRRGAPLAERTGHPNRRTGQRLVAVGARPKEGQNR